MPSLIGTGPNQIPTNNLLGSLAFQDAENVRVENIAVTDLTSTTANLTNVSYSGTLIGGTGVINIGSGQIYKDASGNIGLGVTPSAWSTGKAIELGFNGSSIWSATVAGNIFILSNAVYNGSYKYATSNPASYYQQNAGIHSWYVAPTGTAGNSITFTQVMSLDTNNLMLSGTGATKIQEGTTAQRPAAPQEGMIRKNSTLGDIEAYSGGNYLSLEAGRLIARTRFTSGGTFTPNTKTRMLIVDLISGGGGSGGVASTTAGQVAVSSPGDAGWYVKAYLPRGSTIAASYTIAVGNGGSAGAAGVNAGGAGGITSITDGTNNIVLSGGTGGPGGSATSSFPVIKTNPYSYSLPSASGAFIIWEQKYPSGSSVVVHDSVSKVSVYSVGNPFSTTAGGNDRGGGGPASINWASSGSASIGSAGTAGEVIIYEYS